MGEESIYLICRVYKLLFNVCCVDWIVLLSKLKRHCFCYRRI